MKWEKDRKKSSSQKKTLRQLAETAKKNEFRSHLGQLARNIDNLADVNKDSHVGT